MKICNAALYSYAFICNCRLLWNWNGHKARQWPSLVVTILLSSMVVSD